MRKKAPPPSNVEETVSAAEFKGRCLEFFDRVRDERKPIVVTKRGISVARVVPIPPPGKALRGSMRDAFEIVGEIVNVDWSIDVKAVTRSSLGAQTPRTETGRRLRRGRQRL